MKKYIVISLVILLAGFILIWAGALAKCEFLTYQYGKEFDTIYRENTMLGDIDYLKILEYSDTSARIYYVSINKSSGEILTFIKQDGQWKYNNWETVWSKTGSASEVVWPYWWHFIYGGI